MDIASHVTSSVMYEFALMYKFSATIVNSPKASPNAQTWIARPVDQ